MDNNVLNALCEELAFGLTEKSAKIVRAAVVALLRVLTNRKTAIASVLQQFPDIHITLNKYAGHPFKAEVQQLIELLKVDAESRALAAAEKREISAAKRIQATWRGYRQRKRWAAMVKDRGCVCMRERKERK